MRSVKLALLVMLAVLFAVSTALAAEKHFKAHLTPKEEIKKPKAKSSGKAEFKVNKDGTEISYKLYVKNIKDINGAHIHMGKKGEDGPPIVMLYKEQKKGKSHGLLTEGKITADDMMGDYKGKSINDLVTLMQSGDAYVNVHTDANPDGEIRGQIK
ncbi:CHRD domain-containing protein [Geomonas sp. Red276]